jgi:hypothetical protein
MNPRYSYCLLILKKLYFKLFGNKVLDKKELSFHYSGQEASNKIKQLLLSEKPLMIARFGSGELECVTIGYFKSKFSLLHNSYNYVRNKIDNFWWSEDIKKSMFNNAGFFPPTEKNFEHFTQLMLNDMKELDLLGSWLTDEKYFKEQLKNTVKVELTMLEPYYHKYPWTKALEGKKVLVIHPYSKSIEAQYKKRELLFYNNDVLPLFELVTIKAVQSIAGSNTGYKNWFEAFHYMREQINNVNFDIAIIGCGAYGFPLAAHIKRIGKKAIHLGGATQILFGIKGKRWEDIDFFKQLFNEHWVKPLPEETPQNADTVEAGCYW